MSVAAIDPLRPLSPRPGRYEDDVVAVRRVNRLDRGTRPALVTTRHFRLLPDPRRIVIEHALPDVAIDNDLAALLADELFTPGWLCGGRLFESVMTGVILTARPEPMAAWELFYRNSLRILTHGHDTDFAPVHRRARRLAIGSVLELGCCFGFLSLQLAADGHDVLASDLCPPAVGLLAQMAERLRLPLTTLACDAAAVPRPDRCVDTVLAIHLLEHVDARHGQAVIGEALRLARQRVVVAVPFEDEPDAAFGHVRTFDLDSLRTLGDQCRSADWSASICSYHGGWLVLDRVR